MLKKTKFRLLPILVVVCLAHILAPASADQSSSSSHQSKVIKQGSIRPNESQERPLVAAGPEVSAKSSPPSQSKGGDTHQQRAAIRDDSSRKFQARMMSESEKSAQQQSIRRQDFAAPTGGADSWHAQHGLVPTFTDQEQGDEMVALASDEHGQAEEVRLPRANRTMPIGELSAVQGRPQGQSSELKLSASDSRAPLNSATDEYESEDDEEAEEEAGRPSGGEQEPSLLDSKLDAQRAMKFKLGSSQQTGAERVAYNYAPQNTYERAPRIHQQANYHHHQQQQQQQQQAAVNRSTANGLVRAIDSGWLPTSSNSKQDQMESSLQSSAISRATKQSAEDKSKIADKDSRQHTQSAGERLAGLFGGRDSMNKADVAIEYLRSILKQKQRQTNSTSAATLPAEYSDYLRAQNSPTAAAEQRGSSYERISMLTSRLNKILNATAQTQTQTQTQVQNQNQTGGSEPAMLADIAHGDNPKLAGQFASQPAVSQAAHDLTANGRIRQTGSKFSIAEAKSAAQLDSIKQEQRAAPHQTTTRSAPNESIAAYQSQPMRASDPDINQQVYTDQFVPLPPNGTPLGGDYIESLDDYPRFTQEHPQQHQHQRPGLLEAQSQLVTIRQEAPKRDQQQQSSGPAQQTHASQTPQLELATQAQAMAAEMASFQMQHLPGHLLRLQRQQHEGPRSSRYFMMQQQQQQQQTLSLGDSDSPKQINTAEKIDEKTSSGKDVRGYPSKYESSSPQDARTNYSEPVLTRAKQVTLDHSGLIPRKTNYPEMETLNQATTYHEQIPNRPPAPITPISPVTSHPTSHPSGSKIYSNTEQTHPLNSKPIREMQQQQQQQQQQQASAQQAMPNQPAHIHQPSSQVGQPAKVRPPKIVSYNYFEAPNEGKESELMATNYQLADALYSSTGELGQMLSDSELEAIQSQFLTAEHPIVPIPANDQQAQHYNQQHPDQSLAGLLANLRPEDYPPEALQKLMPSPAKYAEENLKELASNEQLIQVLPPGHQKQLHTIPTQKQVQQQGNELRKLLNSSENKKKKSLIVYLNHPRPIDMSKASDSQNLAHSIEDQPSDSFISAKEFDTQGLSKDTKHLDVSNLRGLGDSKEGQDKDGLSVVVIGDAYKYKKIVLLISSKTGGLKFIPMVKDMKK